MVSFDILKTFIFRLKYFKCLTRPSMAYKILLTISNAWSHWGHGDHIFEDLTSCMYMHQGSHSSGRQHGHQAWMWSSTFQIRHRASMWSLVCQAVWTKVGKVYIKIRLTLTLAQPKLKLRSTWAVPNVATTSASATGTHFTIKKYRWNHVLNNLINHEGKALVTIIL